MSAYIWTRAQRSRLWHIVTDQEGPRGRWAALCGFTPKELWAAPWEPVVFGNQDPPRRAHAACIDKLQRESR
jgi:hypothetical protein